ncbi:MAG: histidinol-phosphate transaminase [Deltaproteobacteria bacterium]|nr:MAG: histidinol-phosphate transaminase [Deltaproteobacteria bacterium]
MSTHEKIDTTAVAETHDALDLRALVPEWIQKLAAYPPGMPLEELEREYGITGSIKLASNENPFGPSPRALAAIEQALSSLNRYPDGSGFYLRRALAERHRVAADAIILGNGSNDIIELVARAFLRRGDDAIMAEQAFVIYQMVVQATGATPRPIPLKHYTHDLDAIAQAIGRHTRIVFLANPNNPTGTIYPRDEWEDFLDSVPSDVVIVADDAYADYVEDPEYPNSLAYHRRGRLLITLRTFSKIYGLAGLRIGYGVGPLEVIEVLNRIRQPFNVSSLAQVAALAALDDTAHVERTRANNRDGLAFLCASCERLGRPYVPSWANFLLIDVGEGARVYEALLRRGVIARPMEVYGLPRNLRVTVGTPAENERFVDGLAAVLGPRT